MIDSETHQKLDLIPFGGLSDDGKTITWYGNQEQWSIIGFEDSYNSAGLLSVGDKDKVISHLKHEVVRQSNCPLAQEVRQYTRGDFKKARSLLEHMLEGYQSVYR